MTCQEIKKNIQIARSAGMSGVELLEDFEVVRRECNGIGANWMPAWSRWMIGVLCPAFVVVSWIHDIRYSRGGTSIDRLNADNEFYSNAKHMAKYRYPQNSFARKIIRNRASAMYALLRAGGHLAWGGNK